MDTLKFLLLYIVILVVIGILFAKWNKKVRFDINDKRNRVIIESCFQKIVLYDSLNKYNKIINNSGILIQNSSTGMLVSLSYLEGAFTQINSISQKPSHEWQIAIIICNVISICNRSLQDCLDSERLQILLDDNLSKLENLFSLQALEKELYFKDFPSNN